MSEQLPIQQESDQENESARSKIKERDRKDWHRGVEMTLLPLFRIKGYDPTPEVDVAQQKQLVDIITVRREDVELEKLDEIPDDYWTVFENFNKYNLISYSDQMRGTGALDALHFLKCMASALEHFSLKRMASALELHFSSK